MISFFQILSKSVIPIVINRKERYNKNNLKSKNKLGISNHKEKKMSTKVEKALELHGKGYNCAQAVACSFCEEFGVDQETMFKISEGFGFGMGMMDMCGAVTGMMMVIGMDNSIGNLENGKSTKADTYKKTKQFAEKFRQKNGTYYCRDLKGVSGKGKVVPCSQCIADAVELTEMYLESIK